MDERRPTRPRRAQRLARQAVHPKARPAAPDSRPPRVAFDRQVLRQAPPGAAGYRLIIPSRSHTQPPQIVPASDALGSPRFWRLDPFQLPDELRLRDGHLYRIVWVNAQGEPVQPQGTRQLPTLHFFLGAPDSAASREEGQYEVVLRNLSDPSERASREAEIARLRLETLNERRQDRQWRRKQAQAEAELRHEMARAQAAAQQLRDTREINQRALAVLQEQRAQQAAEQERNSRRDGLVSLGIMVGFPIVAASLVALIKKLQGHQGVWSELWQSVSAALSAQSSALGQDKHLGSPPPTTGSAPSLTSRPPAAPALIAAAALSTEQVSARQSPALRSAAQPDLAPASSQVASAPPAGDSVPSLSSAPPPSSSAPSQNISPDEQALMNRVFGEKRLIAALGYELASVISPELADSLPVAAEVKQLPEEDRRQVRELVGNPRHLDYVARTYTAYYGEPWPFPSVERTLVQSVSAVQHCDPTPRSGDASACAPDVNGDAATSAVTSRAETDPPATSSPSSSLKRSIPEPGGSAEQSSKLSPSQLASASSPASSTPDSSDARWPAPIRFEPPLTTQEESVLCAIVLDPEKKAQLRYEQRAARAKAEGTAAPKEPITEITAEEREAIRRVAADASLLAVLPSFERGFHAACGQGVEALFRLPAPFRSLSSSDKKWIEKARSISDRGAYLDYLQRRQRALLLDHEVPREPENRLSAKERTLLRQVRRDLRSVAYLEHLERAKFARTSTEGSPQTSADAVESTPPPQGDEPLGPDLPAAPQ